MQFELNYESNLIKLYNDIISWNYQVWKSIAFIVQNPVKREVFAWDFRDRIVHHLIVNKLNHIFERNFIYDSYSCREWKWTLFWIKRVQKFIRSASNNYKQDTYILKLDISGYFMNINKDLLYKKVEKIISNNYFLDDKDLILSLIYKIIYNNPTKNCIIKWQKTDWVWLPKSKSLFFARNNCWLPIWNLTSQVFSNIYLSDFDKFVKNELWCKYYGRYVDDFVIIHKDKEFLKLLIQKIKDYLQTNLWLTLHPKKIYLQHYTHWVSYLWSFVKPYRIYTWKRTKWNFYKKIQVLNQNIRENNWKADKIIKEKFRAIINSYLWFLKHQNSYKLKQKFLLYIVSVYRWNYFYITEWYNKLAFKNK